MVHIAGGTQDEMRHSPRDTLRMEILDRLRIELGIQIFESIAVISEPEPISMRTPQ